MLLVLTAVEPLVVVVVLRLPPRLHLLLAMGVQPYHVHPSLFGLHACVCADSSSA